MKAIHFPAIRLASAVTLLLLLGYLSSAVTRGRCERDIVGRIALETGKTVFLLPEANDNGQLHFPGSERILRSAGFRVRHCASSQRDCFPWAGVRTGDIRWPYIVTVEWGFVAGPLAGAGNGTRFLCIFGLAIRISEWQRWAT